MNRLARFIVSILIFITSFLLDVHIHFMDWYSRFVVRKFFDPLMQLLDDIGTYYGMTEDQIADLEDEGFKKLDLLLSLFERKKV